MYGISPQAQPQPDPEVVLLCAGPVCVCGAADHAGAVPAGSGKAAAAAAGNTWHRKSPPLPLPLCLAVSVCEGEFAGALFGMVCGLLWDYTAGRTVGMLALELLLLCFAVSAVMQLYFKNSAANFVLIASAAALLVLTLDWLFFYYMPGYSWALSRWLTFVLPSAVMTLVPSLVLFSLVRRIYNEFKIDNGVI